ncbi:MAG: GntR family transcriptional regulator [Actinomycetota bacterium]|nr:GntR family transcriptional regulator [Actinomycetota bacterium]
MHASAAERAYEHVKTSILAGSYAGGDLLSEGEVADAVGVSRTPVREALLRLQAEGLVRLYPKKGALVVPITAAAAADVMEARALVESWAAQQAVGRGEELAVTLEEPVRAMREHRASGDVGAFSAADRAFHELIVAASGNEILTRLYRSMRERQICINATAMRVSDERMDLAIADHARFVQLIRSGDHDGFVTLTRTHLEQAAQHVRGAR